jgi:16S rRNA processing protein RimM
MADDGRRPPGLLIRRRSRKAARSPDVAPSAAETPETPAAAVEPEAGDEAGAFLIVARVLRAHGTQGEVACEIVTEFPQRFRRTKRLFLTPPATSGRAEPRPDATPRPHAVLRARVGRHRGHGEVILQLDGVPDRDAAEALRGWLVQVPEREAWKLPRGRYYWHQIVGLRVVTTDGEEIGSVAEILETGANDVYVVKADGGERLIPAIKQVVKEIAPERGEILVELLPGM